MLKSGGAWPARARRNALVKDVIGGFERPGDKNFNTGVWVAGRVVGVLDDGFVLQDESGRMDVVYGGKVGAGDIAEVLLAREERVREDGRVYNVFLAKEYAILAACTNDYFIKKSDSNWRRAIVDLNLKERLRTRAEMVKMTRAFFWERGFTEAETPELVKLPGMEPHLDPFRTKIIVRPHEGLSARESDAYLITSPEYAMKKMLVSGWEKIFQVTRSFRNGETLGSLHNPEFTILEWYRAYDDYSGIMKDTEELVAYLAEKICGEKRVKFGNYMIEMTIPFERKSVSELFEEYCGIGKDVLTDRGKLAREATGKGYKISKDAPYEDIFYTLFLNEIEPKLGILSPVFVYDYPVQMAALAKRSEADPRFAERFELYIGGVELCNAFTELNDPAEQAKRLESEREERMRMGKEVYPVDRSFIGALEFGMPPAGGNALGMDRLAMVLTDTTDINDIMFFPFKDL